MRTGLCFIILLNKEKSQLSRSGKILRRDASVIGKNNQYLKKTKEGTKIETYSIKKFKVGTASVVIGASIFFGAGAVAQASEEVSKNTTTDNSKNEGATLGAANSEKVVAKPVVKEATKEEVAAGVAEKLGVKETVKEAEKELVKTLDKTQLSSFISEIEGKISSGAYANKTEESVANLVVDLNAAKVTLASATTQEELTKAYQKLVVSVNSKLRNKPVEKKEALVVESTTSKETVGEKAENTEKKVEINLIENTGAKDPRNGKEIAKNTAFRAAVNQDPKVDFTFSIPDEKKIYIYNEEHFSLEIPVYSETGKIRYATIKKGSRQRFPNVAGTENDLDVEFGFTATVINRAETVGVTSDASQANPAKIVITGRPNDILKKHRDYTKQENQTLNVGTRYIQVVDDQGRENLKKGDSIADPGYFYLVLKSQAKKYALRSQGTDEKISVSSLTNPTAEDLQKIKDSIQLEYSTTNEDARLANKRGTLVEHPEDVIQSVNIVGNNIVVTFTDGSTKTKPVSEIVQKNIPPVVNLPYSNEANRNIYIYSGEETDLTFTATDESKIKDLKLRGPGDINYNNATSFGLAVGNIVDSAVTSGEGSVSEDKKTATIKMTGTTNLGDGKKWTSVIVAKDDNNGESAPFNGRINATTNPAERQKIAGYVEFVVKNQTKKYDIKAPDGTVSVIDPTNVTAEEFEKIKEKVKIEYSQTNDDANLTSKRGQAVDNQATRISTITRDSNGNLVVTYKDGSTDTKPLSEFTSLNKQPAIDVVNKAAEDKIAEINANTNATAEEKAVAIQKVNADKTKALTAINDNSVTTKAALDNAKTSGTTAISNDNPVATKKDTAKASIDTALREKEAVIDANNALTTEEKNAAKADAQAKATAAKTAIDNATTDATVDSAKTAGVADVESVNPQASQKKTDAKNAVDGALKAKNDAIDANNDLTDEEKTAAKADAKAKADAAKTAIDNATTNAAVEQAKTDGATSVDSVNPTAQAKPAAKKAIDDALKAKNDAIDANNDLTAEEKAKAKEDAKAKADAAKTAIDNARTNDAVTQAKNDGATSVDLVNPTAQAKPAAKKAIDDALKAKNDAIDANNDLTDEEKAKAKEDAKAKADAAKTAIDNATTNAAVEQAKADGATSVDSVNPTPVVKPAAKKAIDDALKAKNDAIDANNDLTAEEKTAAKQEAQDKATAAKQAIDNATTNAAVDQAKANGTTEVNNVNPTPVAKPAAKKAIDDALKAKNDAIDANNDLTAEEKVKAKEDAKAKADAAKQAIDNATTNAGVDQAKANGTTEVNNVNPTPVAKPAAKKAVEDALADKIKEIDTNNDLTDEEKTAAKQEAQDKATAAKTAIDNATTNAGVDQAKANGTTEVNNVNPTPVAKPAAKKAVEDALAEKIKAIDANNDLTDEEKAAAKQEAQDKAAAAKQAIDNATTNAGVDQAKANGTTEVNNVNPTPVAKPAAKKAVEDALAEKIKAIDANNDLTDEEKAAAKQEAQDKAAAAKQAIDNARTNAGVDQAKANGTTEVNNVKPTPVAKPAAKKAIDDALKAKEAAIDANNNLTAEEKTAAKKDAQAKADAAKQAIDNATTNDAVTQAKNDGATSVASVNPTPVAKPAAKKAVEDALAEKIKAIDANNDLTAEEKAKAKEDAKAKADAAKTAIDNATTNDAVTQAKADGATSVDSVNPTPAAKPAAKKAIDDALKAKNDAIDANNDLTDEEKTAAKADAKAKADAAKQAIDNATTNDAVTQAKNDGATSVDSVNPTAQAKPAAKKAIDDALKAKNDAIDANNDLTDEEKTAAKADAKAKADAAKTAIDTVTTNAEVEQAKNNGATSVDSVNPTPVAKPAAKKAVEDALAEKIKAIDANNDLTAEEKVKAKEDAKAKADAAKTAIDNATTNAEVEQAKASGTTEVNNVNPTPVAKPAAKKAVEDALADKIKEIDANNDLTAEEKVKAKQEAQDKAAAAKQAIDNATTNAGVDQAKASGTTEVNNVNPTPVAKPAAKKAVEDALADKIKEIDANNDLTDEEKTAAKQEAQDKAAAAKQAIDNARTNAGVDQAKANGTTEVNNVNPTPVAKPAAKKAIEDALKVKEAEIDARDDLTAEEKMAAKEEAKAKADAAKQAVDKATTNADVENAKTTGVADVNSLNPVAVKKPEAKKAVDEALKAKEAEIDANNDLTAEEKLAAKEEAKAKADAAKQAIDGADTDIKVDVNSISGLSDVNSFSPEPVKKSEAKKAIDAALEKKIEEIDARDDLTTEEKSAAKAEAENKANQAKEAIDAVDTDIKVDENSVLGLSDVSSFSPEAAKKPAAKKAIDDALKAKEDAIDANDDLTAEEKAKAKAEAKAKADAAKEAIDNATRNAEVEQAKIAGTTKVDSVNPLAVKKPEAKKAIDEALKAKTDEIDANNDLTDEEKTAAKAEAKKKADAAKEAIDNATTNAEVEQAKTAGTTKVDSVNPTAIAKPEAKKAIDEALKAKNDEIDARTDLTDEEKTVAKEEAKAKADAAKEAIDKAITNAKVEQAKTAGTTEVNNVNPTAEAKPEAKKAIDEILKAKNDEIDARTDLTDEEKTVAKADAKAKADAAKEAIDKATTNAGVEIAKNDGTTEVTSVDPQPVAKTEAKKAIDEALKAKNDEIDAHTDLTDEEKAKAKEEAKAKADAAKEAIDNATTNAAVDQAKANGTTEVNDVNPTAQAKPAAKQAIDDALKAKDDEIDARTDLTDEEKTAAKEEAKKKADAAKEAIDKATTNAEVDQAKVNGTTEVNNVNPTAQAKPAAKQAIDEALKAKNDEIDASADLTDEEKTAAKAEAKKKADGAKEAIDKATTNAEVEQAKTNGTSEVTSVNPQPEAKPEAKKAVDEALKAKNNEIDARTDLTDEEKTAAKANAKAIADGAKEAIDKAATNAEVDQAKTNGTLEVTSVNPEAEAKTEAKEAIDEALKAKNDQIDARTDLTDEEKTAAKEEAKAKADAAKEAIDKATTNAEVDQAKVNGTTEVTSVNPEAVAKVEAKKAIDDKLAEQLKAIVSTPDATDEEKKAAAELAKQLAEIAKKAIGEARENADVKKLQDDSKVGIEEAVPFVEDKPNARKAIDEEAKAKKVAIDARTDISDKVKELLKAEVDEIATQAKKAIDAASSVNELNKIVEAKKSEIKAVEEVRVPAEKVIVANPANLTDEEKAKVLAAIKSVNPDAKEITQDEKGNVVVVTANGHKQVISAAQVTKTEADLAKENAGNVVNTPVAKTAVADVTKLTEAEKQEIIAKVKLVNHGATVAIDEKGNVIVTNGEGLVFVLPVLDLVIPTDKLTDITANSKVNTPAIRTLVANKGSLTSEEIAKIKAAIEEINPGALVVVDEKGNTTVTTKDGKSMTISSDVLVKNAADVAIKNNGENINLDFDKEVVEDINNLTESDKEKVKFKVLGAIREAIELIVDEKGNAMVILKDGRTFTILAKDIFEQRKEVTVNLPEKVKVKDASNLTETEKEAVKQALITANPNLKDAKITISKTGEATIVYHDGQVAVISAKNLVVAEKVTGTIIESNSGIYTKEDKKPTLDYSNDNTPKFNAKKGQRLANTGEAETNTGLAGIGMALLGGLLAAAKRRKEKEE